jgi:SNF2 family DNA or RNA helicase
MAGILMKELIVRGDLQRCLVVCPGSLVEQWQDELYRRFQLPFEILTNDKLEAARTGNWFLENDFVIARLDKLSRNEDVQAKLAAPLGSKAEVARELCYRLYTLCKRKKRAAEALSYNGLVQSWPEIARLVREGSRWYSKRSCSDAHQAFLQ